MQGEFSVTQFFSDDHYETVRTHVDATEAVAAFKHYISNVASTMGLTQRVIITDGGDCICCEWQYKKGIVFPLNLVSS